MLNIEWAGLTPELVLISTPERQWVHRNRAWGPFARPMTGPGSKVTTRGLLDGAARMGWAAASRQPEPPLTQLRWAYRLCGFYLTTHATPPLISEAAARFKASSRPELIAWADTKAREEQGHDALALADLRALGLPAEAAVARIAPAIPAALVRKFEGLVRSDNPVRCVGYTYALERLALEVDGAYIAAVEACLPPGVRATRCLRVHSSVGSDRAHVDETIGLVANLPPAERASIALACYETSLLCCAAEGNLLTDENLGRLFASLRNDRSNHDE